jgi:Na+/H+ antiporter NhaA
MSNSNSANAVRRLVDPLKDFLHTEAAGGLFLLAATVVVLGWANSPLGAGYEGLWVRELTMGAGPLSVTEDLKHSVNDGLMAVFFCVVGLEINSSSRCSPWPTPGCRWVATRWAGQPTPVAWGVALGLLAGKILRVAGTSLVPVRLRLGLLPDLAMRHVLGLAALAGIGFTVSLFIAELAYPGSDLVDLAKVGILAGSLVSGLAGAALLVTGRHPSRRNPAAAWTERGGAP